MMLEEQNPLGKFAKHSNSRLITLAKTYDLVLYGKNMSIFSRARKQARQSMLHYLAPLQKVKKMLSAQQCCGVLTTVLSLFLHLRWIHSGLDTNGLKMEPGIEHLQNEQSMNGDQSSSLLALSSKIAHLW